MIAPTENELSFLRKLAERGGQLALQDNMGLLKIDRLIPDYVTSVRASGLDARLFTLTKKGRQLLRSVDQR
jgi:hypothetical protein